MKMNQHQQVLEYPKLRNFTSAAAYGQAIIAHNEKIKALKSRTQAQTKAQEPVPNPLLLSPKSYRDEQNLLDLENQMKLIQQKQEEDNRKYEAYKQLISERTQKLKREQREFQQNYIKRINQERVYQNQLQNITQQRISLDDIRNKQKCFVEQTKKREINFQQEKRRIQKENANINSIQMRSRQQNIASNKMEIQNTNGLLQTNMQQKSQPVLPKILENNKTDENPFHRLKNQQIQNKPLFGKSEEQNKPVQHKTQPEGPKITLTQQPTQAKTQKFSASDFLKQLKDSTPAIWNQPLPQQKSAVENYKRIDAQLAVSGLKSNLFSEKKIFQAQAQKPKKKNTLFQQKLIQVKPQQVLKPSSPVSKVQIQSIQPTKKIQDSTTTNIFNQQVYESRNVIKKQQVPQNMFNKSNQAVQSIFNRVQPTLNMFNKPKQGVSNLFSKPQNAQNLFNKPKQTTNNFFGKSTQKAQEIESKIPQTQRNLFNQAKDTNVLNQPNNMKPQNAGNNSLFMRKANELQTQFPNKAQPFAKPVAPPIEQTVVHQNLFQSPQPSSLFNSPQQRPNIFSKPQAPSSIFASTLNTSTNMFTNKPRNLDNLNNMFANNNNQDEDQGEGDDEQLQKEQEMTVDPKLSNGNFQYEQADVLFKEDANKFKMVNANVLIENVRVSFEKYPNSNNTLLIVRLANKVISFTGLVLPGKTEIAPISTSSVSVVVKSILKIEGAQKQPQNLRILFKTSQAADKFLEVAKQRLTMK